MINYIKNKGLVLIFLVLIISFISKTNTFAKSTTIPFTNIDINISDSTNSKTSTSMQLLFLFTIISLAPSILILLTCFTRIIIVLHFLRSALGTQQMPPNQVLIGLALFLTFYIMGPVFTEINENAIKPYSSGKINQVEVIDLSMKPIREYMFKQVRTKDLSLFVNLSGEQFKSYEDIPNRILIPSYILTELTVGFIFGFFIYIPFIVIDMIVSSILMAMGMMMLPPAMISLPFKILLFILVDGWKFVIETLIKTFYTN